MTSAHEKDMEDERFYRIEGLPISLESELREAAVAAGLPLKGAFLAFLRGLDSVPAAIMAGQQIAGGGDALGETADVGVHIPREDKDALLAAARAAGVKRGAAGRLILLSRRGRIAQVISLGRAQMTTTTTPA